MKRQLSILMGLVFCCVMARADEIHLTDGTVIRGRVVRVTDDEVRYSAMRETTKGSGAMLPGLEAAGEKKLDGKAAETEPAHEEERTVPRDRAQKIVYDGGSVLTLAKALAPDRLFLYDGHIMEGKVTRITGRYVAFRAADSKTEQIIGRDIADRVVFGDGREVQLGLQGQGGGTGGKAPGKEERGAAQDEGTLHRITVEFMTGRTWLEPVWKTEHHRIRVLTFPFHGEDTIRRSDIDTAQDYRGALGVRLHGSLWLDGFFSYARFTFTNSILSSGSQTRGEGKHSVYEAGLLLRFMVTDNFGLFGSLCYSGYLQHIDDILITLGSIYSFSERRHFHGAVLLAGMEYTMPIFLFLGLHIKAAGGVLVGKEECNWTWAMTWPLPGNSESKTTGLLADILIGPRVTVTPINTSLTVGFRYRYLYYTRHENFRYHSGGDETSYGIECALRYTY